ncbi:hypothetical protein AXG93_3810s1190 [Marchantia polymorpha subsp. ruderalis]|uniref:Hexosyltransferase n=1 Tax=Marchantia polymorpha subsp. ruderalis TaxID=1480154 RepID=A0A176VCY2_MARPO|nr:hypothetical protein AXG93_3810s1190 [Marchantia polymorpha subsp. ruderalis]
MAMASTPTRTGGGASLLWAEQRDEQKKEEGRREGGRGGVADGAAEGSGGGEERSGEEARESSDAVARPASDCQLSALLLLLLSSWKNKLEASFSLEPRSSQGQDYTLRDHAVSALSTYPGVGWNARSQTLEVVEAVLSNVCHRPDDGTQEIQKAKFWKAFRIASIRHRTHNADCLTRKFGPGAPWRSNNIPQQYSREFVTALELAAKTKLPKGVAVPETIHALIDEAKAKNYDTKTLLATLSAMVENKDEQTRTAKLQEALYRHFASSGIPKGMHCLSLKLTSEYSTNALARQDLPSPDLAPGLTDNSLHHYVVATDNVLAASVVVSSAIKNALEPRKIVFHVITDQKTYAAMHSWFSLHPLPPAIVEVKGVHQFDWLTKDNVPVLEVLESSADILRYYHGDHSAGTDLSDSPTILAAKLQARSPKYISIMNHLRIYLPDLFPELNKVLFLDDDVVVQRDLGPLWDIDMQGKVNGAVETCRGEDPWVMSKHFRNYFNFSNPVISNTFSPDQCAWAYVSRGLKLCQASSNFSSSFGGNWALLFIIVLIDVPSGNISTLLVVRLLVLSTFHSLTSTNTMPIPSTLVMLLTEFQNLRSNLTLWRLGTLPPALIAFDGYVHPISSSWHMLGLGYHAKSNIENIRKSGVIHYNGQAKPWLEIGFPELRPFWAKYVNYSNEFIRHCNILQH